MLVREGLPLPEVHNSEKRGNPVHPLWQRCAADAAPNHEGSYCRDNTKQNNIKGKWSAVADIVFQNAVPLGW